MEENCCLIVEDDFLIASQLSMLLEKWGYNVCGIASTADEAVQIAAEHRPGRVLMDFRLSGAHDGVDASLQICENYVPRVIFITGSAEPETVQKIQTDHAHTVLFKPVDFGELKLALAS